MRCLSSTNSFVPNYINVEQDVRYLKICCSPNCSCVRRLSRPQSLDKREAHQENVETLAKSYKPRCGLLKLGKIPSSYIRLYTTAHDFLMPRAAARRQECRCRLGRCEIPLRRAQGQPVYTELPGPGHHDNRSAHVSLLVKFLNSRQLNTFGVEIC
jgi:hypothetical protein